MGIIFIKYIKITPIYENDIDIADIIEEPVIAVRAKKKSKYAVSMEDYDQIYDSGLFIKIILPTIPGPS